MSTEYVENILSVYRRATTDQLMEGMSWYQDAHLIAREAGNVTTGAGIISALSPRMPWGRNIVLARKAYTGPLEGGALKRSIATVNAILSGIHPLDVLGGLKTRAFFDNILNPLTSNEVTVDTHAIKIAGINRHSVGKGLYNDIANAYREAAKEYGIMPLEMQAVTWTVYRNGGS